MKSFVVSGVFGVDADEVKSVSVMEGHSVTLHTDLTHIQRFDKIEWIDESQSALMAQICTRSKSSSIYDGYDERFKVKLKLENQTGSLTITNISMIQSGLYKLKICNNKTSYRRFNVTVYVEADEVKSVSVMEGDSVTLHTDLTHIQTPDEILWMFEPQGTGIAEIHKQSNSSYIYDDDASFKGKLQLDDQTGSLTITNIRIKNSGLYKLTVRNNKKRFYKKFNVTIYGKFSHNNLPITKI
ncbi:hypothetical protein E1301_Tti023348 [Triplophysa tibetana]|uniref:Immunoglobulin domain-containing protein n=1 Tax=Triplophysa tibetana TaxID=1572043 RepID=A0A5A9NQJ1_9TELE|nr:hypothetical protein E1301_Tti023348 [Triplophysa tibetana]